VSVCGAEAALNAAPGLGSYIRQQRLSAILQAAGSALGDSQCQLFGSEVAVPGNGCSKHSREATSYTGSCASAQQVQEHRRQQTWHSHRCMPMQGRVQLAANVWRLDHGATHRPTCISNIDLSPKHCTASLGGGTLHPIESVQGKQPRARAACVLHGYHTSCMYRPCDCRAEMNSLASSALQLRVSCTTVSSTACTSRAMCLASPHTYRYPPDSRACTTAAR
jgi:hypothetical protein